MPTPFAQRIAERLGDALSKTPFAADLPADFVVEAQATDHAKFGDYHWKSAMGLAKILKRSPVEIAGAVVGAFDGSGLCHPPEIAGPGYVNFRITDEVLARHLADLLADSARLGVATAGAPKTIVLDFSAPNVAKPMHVGHIRSTILGDCLGRIARFLGHRVVTDNHIGDWGTQFGMILWGWKHLLDEAALEADAIAELLRVYREVNARTKADEAALEECKRELVKLQGGDAENLAIWERCVALSKAGLQRIYDLLEVKFDHWYGESYYNDRLAPLVEDLLAKGIAEESEGAVCVFFRDDERLADKPLLIRKSDGGYLYGTTDLATIDFRLAELGADAIWYVVGAPQDLHFQQVFAVSKRRGQHADFRHIAFGSILGKDRKMLKTRSGDTVQLADVLAESAVRARAIIEEKNPDLPEEEKAEIARVVGIGSVKYAELSQFRMTDYIFDWDTMLSLKGNTAPYLINAYVRTRAIFRKLGSEFDPAGGLLALTDEAERALLLKLAQYAEAVPTILEDFRPNALAAYLYELATTYHQFWEACPVLKVEGDVRHTRLALCELTGRVLRHGLGLLGIGTTERM